ncbi:formate dehydrogenase accessory sulfurtransferase FdhD [Pseudodonghicola flavimaris]|uniref:Sulfur carrier protein FdhD n=1 Tax=Pseudodonghicola flavimaris TaxID=3050036 RepID=A0ABT7F174_9RHOB|nr:formate dehydrogenase accessory sulfurtransferase FdhD [Pseudodonghicola flavimaris]MDK3018224.1 formate dehydrogenase accessory sulfurtransferase FdhD [Pseudodonghicola flavimaris]
MRRPAHSTAPGLSVQRDGARRVTRALPEEVPVAMVFDGTTQAVMMASPTDLEDFATGFALTEGFIETADQIAELEIAHHAKGIEARFWLNRAQGQVLAARRRSMAGPVGCGLCGIDSIDQAIRPLPRLRSNLRLHRDQVAQASDTLRHWQPLHDRTRAVHAAGALGPDGRITCAREDVGRHNALDKLIGALVRGGQDPAQSAFVITSRVSVEMVQKTVMAGCPVLIAVSAPTALAVSLAEEAGLTLAAFARGGGFDLYAHPQRIETGATDVA